MNFFILKIVVLLGLIGGVILYFVKKRSDQTQLYKVFRIIGYIFWGLAGFLIAWQVSIIWFLVMNDGLGFT